MGHGEPPETAWASLNGFSRRTTNMSHVGRHNILEAAIESEAMNKRKSTAKTLVKMMKKATKAEEEGESERAMAIKQGAEEGVDLEADTSEVSNMNFPFANPRVACIVT